MLYALCYWVLACLQRAGILKFDIDLLKVLNHLLNLFLICEVRQ